MPVRNSLRAIVVGAGPNGLAAAIRLAEAGWRVTVFEANETPGGAVRSMPITIDGFSHDFGSAVFPLGLGSPFFRRLPLEKYGLEWIHPEVPVAHPLDGGRAVLQYRSIDRTAEGLGRDGAAYRRFFGPVLRNWSRIEDDVLRPLLHPPEHPIALARFGMRALLPPQFLADRFFKEEPARALWAGIVAHSARPFSAAGATAFGLLLVTLAHRLGWPVPRGGSGAITRALVAHLESLGGEVVTNTRIEDLDDLPPRSAVLLDVAPGALLRIAGDRLPSRYRRSIAAFRHGPGTFKLDYALDGPIPWANADCGRAGTVHLGGTLEEIAESEAAVEKGRAPERPYVLLAQPSLIDPTRAPQGNHVLWAYCHVPNGSTTDMTAAIEDQLERFAPGFRKRILARHTMHSMDLQAADANLVGGDISGGRNSLWQLLARPVLRPNPYRTPGEGIYLCSASTPPGGGVHGMCGLHAAETVLRDFDSDRAR
jgi:phytoene dehydrogenase-like protein